MSAAHREYSIFKVGINLTLACLISGLIIAGTYYITAPVAAEKAVIMKNEAMKSLVKDAKEFKKVEGKDDWYAAEKDGKPYAYVVPSESKGFGGAIKLLVAVTPDGKVIDYTILSHNETPGLGDGAVKESWRKQFWGRELKDLVVVKDTSNTNNIQAMTGATISSRAVTLGVKEAVEQVKEFAGGK